MVEFAGLGHSAAIHTKDKLLLNALVRIKACVFGTLHLLSVVSVTFTMPSSHHWRGCGSYGHNSGGDNVSAISLLNIKKVGKRRNNMQWFKVQLKNLLRTQFYQYLQTCTKILNALWLLQTDLSKNLVLFNVLLINWTHRVTISLLQMLRPDPDITTVERGLRKWWKHLDRNAIIALWRWFSNGLASRK